MLSLFISMSSTALLLLDSAPSSPPLQLISIRKPYKIQRNTVLASSILKHKFSTAGLSCPFRLDTIISAHAWKHLTHFKALVTCLCQLKLASLCGSCVTTLLYKENKSTMVYLTKIEMIQKMNILKIENEKKKFKTGKK